MNLRYPLALLTASLIATASASAQSFVNGSLEAVAGSTPCDYVHNDVFYSTLNSSAYSFGNTTIGGTTGRIYLANATCGEGTPKAGSYFLALSSNSTQADIMSLRLTSALQANKAYKLLFYMKRSKVLLPISLDIGYTADSMAFGTLVKTLPVPADTVWALQTITFTPTVSTRYITVRGVKTTVIGLSMTEVDNFSIAATTAVEPPAASFSAAPAPNPFRTSLDFTLGNDVAMPCRITLCDVAGKVIREYTAADRRQQMTRGSISAGVYLLSVRDANGAASFTRVVAE